MQQTDFTEHHKKLVEEASRLRRIATRVEYLHPVLAENLRVVSDEISKESFNFVAKSLEELDGQA